VGAGGCAPPPPPLKFSDTIPDVPLSKDRGISGMVLLFLRVFLSFLRKEREY